MNRGLGRKKNLWYVAEMPGIKGSVRKSDRRTEKGARSTVSLLGPSWWTRRLLDI